MSGKRIVEETPCQHDKPGPHPMTTDEYGVVHCHGVRRRVLTEGQYVLIEKVDGEWPEWADQAVVNAMSIWTHVGRETQLYKQLFPRARRFLDALSDHTEGTP